LGAAIAAVDGAAVGEAVGAGISVTLAVGPALLGGAAAVIGAQEVATRATPTKRTNTIQVDRRMDLPRVNIFWSFIRSLSFLKLVLYAPELI